MIKQISENVWKFYYNNLGSDCYLVKTENKNILIDAGGGENREELIYDLEKIKINPDEINTVFLTHLHYDHIGNLDLFRNAKVYASKQEIEDFKKQPFETVLNKNFIEKFSKPGKIEIMPVENFKLKSIKIIKVPGHTNGSLAFFLPQEKILFSGDTLFDGGIGRTDLPTSKPEKMQASLKKLENIDYKILCPGH